MPDQLSLEPGRTALLVMDYQNGIVSRMAEQDALLERTSAAIASTRAHGGQVGWVRVAFTEAELGAIPESSVFAAMTAGGRGAQMHADGPETQIHSQLDHRPEDIAVRKRRVGGFTTTDLDEQLRARGIDTLVLAGLSTSGVVLSTVREAMDRDYRIVVLHDACADGDSDAHAFLTTKIYPRHTTVIAVKDLDALWA
jgi:nicotinamidase-related amidase